MHGTICARNAEPHQHNCADTCAYSTQRGTAGGSKSKPWLCVPVGLSAAHTNKMPLAQASALAPSVDTSDKSLHAPLHMLALHHSLHTLLHLHEQTLPRRLHQDPAHCKFHADVLTGHWLKKTLPPTCRLCRHRLDTREVSGHLCSLWLGLSGWRTGTLGFHVRPYCCATISPRPLSNGGGHLLGAFPRVRGSAEHALGQVLPAHDNSKV